MGRVPIYYRQTTTEYNYENILVKNSVRLTKHIIRSKKVSARSNNLGVKIRPHYHLYLCLAATPCLYMSSV